SGFGAQASGVIPDFYAQFFLELRVSDNVPAFIHFCPVPIKNPRYSRWFYGGGESRHGRRKQRELIPVLLGAEGSSLPCGPDCTRIVLQGKSQCGNWPRTSPGQRLVVWPAIVNDVVVYRDIRDV